MVEHFSEEASRVCTSTKPKEIDIVSRRIVPHQETITSHDMISECRTNCRVLCLVVPGLETRVEACVFEGIACDVCTNAGLVVVESVSLRSVEHSIYLQDIAVRVRSAELVTRTIKTENESGTQGLCHG